MKVGFFERPLVKYCEVMRKQRVQNLSALEVYLEVAQVDFMYHWILCTILCTIGNSLMVAEVGTTHIAQLAYASALSLGGPWTEGDLQLSFQWPTRAQ